MLRSSPRAHLHDELTSLATSVEWSGAQTSHTSLTSYRFDRGQTLVEYALIIALVAIVVIAALYLLGPALATTYNVGPSTL